MNMKDSYNGMYFIVKSDDGKCSFGLRLRREGKMTEKAKDKFMKGNRIKRPDKTKYAKVWIELNENILISLDKDILGNIMIKAWDKKHQREFSFMKIRKDGKFERDIHVSDYLKESGFVVDDRGAIKEWWFD